MDLRLFSPTEEQTTRAAHLAYHERLFYQPFIVSDDLEVGMGMEMVSGHSGLLSAKNIPDQYKDTPGVTRWLINPENEKRFTEENQCIRELYDNMISFVEDKMGPASNFSFADVGCCSGYFPVKLSLHGAKRAVGYDRSDYTEAFDLLNEITGAKAEFVNKGYRSGTVEGAEQADIVFSIAVLLHLSDPLHHLSFLGNLAGKAVFIWTNTMGAMDTENEEDLLIRFNPPNRYYVGSRFPYCFDLVYVTPALLRVSLEKMGFTEIHEFDRRPAGMSVERFRQHRGYLAIRP